MKWPAVVRFENNDELEIIDSQSSWDAFLRTVTVDCELILSDGALINITSTRAMPSLTISNHTVSVDAAIALARRHMAAHAHCCVSKFNASTVEAVITALVQLED